MAESRLFLASLISLLAIVARAGQFSQRLDMPFSTFSWTPLVPVAASPQNLQQPIDNGRAYNARNQDNAPPANGGVDSPRLLSSSPPHSRTVTASITWPPDHEVPEVRPESPHSEPQPQPQPDPGPLPDDDINGSGQQDDDPIAVPETDPPVLETPNGRPEDHRVVKTTLKTPLSHGYVVALVKKPRRLKSYFKSKVSDAVPDDQPAFFVYVPPNRQKGIRRNQLALRARGPPQLRANGAQPPGQQYQRAGPARTNGALRYAVLPIVGHPDAVNQLSQHLQGLGTPAPPAVLVYLPQERTLHQNAPVIIPINPPVPFNSVLHQSKPDVAPVLSGDFLNGASSGAPWLPPSLESTPEEVVKYAWSQMGKYRA